MGLNTSPFFCEFIGLLSCMVFGQNGLTALKMKCLGIRD
jgi:hypothetical protein